MCPLVRNEIVESWLAVTVFELSRPEEVPELLTSDRWMTLHPAHRFVKHIDIKLFDESNDYRPRPSDNLCSLEALALLQPAAWPVFRLDFNRSNVWDRYTLIMKFERVLQRVWEYTEILSRARIDVVAETHVDVPRSVTLGNGSDTVADWTEELKQVSLSRDYQSIIS